MNRRDDWAETCFHKKLSDRVEYQGVFPGEENCSWQQGSGKARKRTPE